MTVLITGANRGIGLRVARHGQQHLAQDLGLRVGGAGASITGVKQRRIIFAARHYLQRLASLPPCRFDVVLVQGASKADDRPTIEWLQSAFDAS